MDYRELRPLTLLALKQERPIRINDLILQVDRLAVDRGYYLKEPDKVTLSFGTHRMPREDLEKVREIIHEFVFEGILMWGIDILNQSPSNIKITRYGEECLRSDEILPYDPDGYLKSLCEQIPNLDETIKLYIDEALQTFLRGNLFASTVMVGCASEKGILLLIESFAKAISEQSERIKFEKEMSALMISRKFEGFKRKLDSVKDKLPRSLTYGMDSQLAGVFEVIRTSRNEVGHPTGRKIERSEAYTNLVLFVRYCKLIYELIGFFGKNHV